MNSQSRRRFRSGALLSVTLLLTAALWLPAASTTAAATPTTFSGQATALKGNLLGLGPLVSIDCKDSAAQSSTICLAATQSFSGATEINDEASVLCYPAAPGKCVVTAPDVTGGALVVDVLHASVNTSGNKSSAEAYVAQFALTVPGATISATALRTTAEAKCTNGAPSVSGGESTTVTINDTTFNVSKTVEAAAGTESERIDLPGGLGYIVLNEGASSGRPGNDITVSALHVVVPTLGIDIFVAQAHADITCATNGCAGKNAFVTSGGFIDWNGSKAHFAVAGRNLTLWGHVLYGPTKLHVKNPMANVYDTRTGLEGDQDYLKFHAPRAPAPDTFQGAAILTFNDGSGTGQVLVIDMGEPGRSDFFEIHATGADAWGTLAGGNIQMHGKCG
jgi:hypothetical protein